MWDRQLIQACLFPGTSSQPSTAQPDVNSCSGGNVVKHLKVWCSFKKMGLPDHVTVGYSFLELAACWRRKLTCFLFVLLSIIWTDINVMWVIYVTHSGTDILWQRTLTFALARINNTMLYVLVWDADIRWRKAGLREGIRVISLSIHKYTQVWQTCGNTLKYKNIALRFLLDWTWTCCIHSFP